MTLNDDQKIQVLLAGLGERYEAMRVIRDRVQNIGIWALGLLAGAGGWLLQSEARLSDGERWISVIGLSVALLVLRFWYLADLQRGFASQQRVAATIEETLGFFRPGGLGLADKAVYPSSWREAGRTNGRGRFFSSTYLLLYAGAGFLAGALLLSS